MIHYSVVPLEAVFDGMERFSPSYIDIEHGGVTMQVEPLNGYQARIVRLTSGNPQHYLDGRYAPGSIIDFSPAL
ncbi:YlzJ-like family protein [Paenibacillus athensensis]|uniref:Uncharacterized protein n=1 Tax=Paenibacillus athensensis TaxID=1967502 RepID=A0A4Y8QA07_9BACL|nr:YlzJ-like family protein [Paenibacillus athensensis]MCD1257758.1 YlzJ-like family protein [Paenibacillus athensensis]